MAIGIIFAIHLLISIIVLVYYFLSDSIDQPLFHFYSISMHYGVFIVGLIQIISFTLFLIEGFTDQKILIIVSIASVISFCFLICLYIFSKQLKEMMESFIEPNIETNFVKEETNSKISIENIENPKSSLEDMRIKKGSAD